MTTNPTTHASIQERSAPLFDAGRVLGLLRSAVGIGSWVSPSITARTFGLGSLGADAGVGVVTRLFGVRELALARAARHPSPDVRRTALQAGVAVDSIDIVATLIAVRKGAPKVLLLTFAVGAALFAGLGVAALAKEQA